MKQKADNILTLKQKIGKFEANAPWNKSEKSIKHHLASLITVCLFQGFTQFKVDPLWPSDDSKYRVFAWFSSLLSKNEN